jgi:hypothetical protein
VEESSHSVQACATTSELTLARSLISASTAEEVSQQKATKMITKEGILGSGMFFLENATANQSLR